MTNVMHKNIQDLAVQCGAEVSRDFGVAIPRDDTFDIEKFAHLIINECASLCELNSKFYKHTLTAAKAQVAETTSVYCGTLIRKHFGAE